MNDEFAGASKFIELNQPASGTDLAELFIEALQKANAPVSSPILNQIESLFAKIPAELASEISTSGQKACSHIFGISVYLLLLNGWSWLT